MGLEVISGLSSLNASTNDIAKYAQKKRHLSIDVGLSINSKSEPKRRLTIGDPRTIVGTEPILEREDEEPESEAINILSFREQQPLEIPVRDLSFKTKELFSIKENDISDFAIHAKSQNDKAISPKGYSGRDLTDLLASAYIEAPVKQSAQENIKYFLLRNKLGLSSLKDPTQDKENLYESSESSIANSNQSSLHDTSDDSASLKLANSYAYEPEPEPESQGQEDQVANEDKPVNVVTVYRGLDDITESQIHRYRLRPQNSMDWLHVCGVVRKETLEDRFNDLPDLKEQVPDDDLPVVEQIPGDVFNKEFITKSILGQPDENFGSRGSKLDEEIRIDELDELDEQYVLEETPNGELDSPDQNKVSRLIVLPVSKDQAYKSFEMEEDDDVM